MNFDSEKITAGNIITIVIFIFGIIGSSVGTYYTMKNTGISNKTEIQELNARVHNLNTRVQKQVAQTDKQWNSLIKQLDSRYVNKSEFKEFRKSVENRLAKIDSNVQYLIRLEIEQK